jgi:hypothetical protein
MPFEEALEIINDRNVLRKTFKFMGSKEYNRRLYVLNHLCHHYYCLFLV